MSRTMRPLRYLIIAALAVTALTGCSGGEPEPEPTPTGTGPVVAVPQGPTDEQDGTTPGTEPGDGTGTPTPSPDTTTPAPTEPSDDGLIGMFDFEDNPDDSSVPIDGLVCGQREGSATGLCVVDLPGWPSRDEMLAAGVTAQRFVDTIWTFNALAETGPTGPNEALNAAIDRFGTPDLRSALAGVTSGPSWQSFANMGARMTTPGVGFLDAIPVTERPFSETEFTVTVNYTIRLWVGQRHTNHWTGGPQNVYLTMTRTDDGWRVSNVDTIDMPANLIEWNGTSF